MEDLIRHNRRAGALTQIKGADGPAPSGPQNCERTSILATEFEQTQHETEVTTVVSGLRCMPVLSLLDSILCGVLVAFVVRSD